MNQGNLLRDHCAATAKGGGSDRVDATLEVDDRSEPSAPLPEESVFIVFVCKMNMVVFQRLRVGICNHLMLTNLMNLSLRLAINMQFRAVPKFVTPSKLNLLGVNSALAASSKRPACDAAEASMGAPGFGVRFSGLQTNGKELFWLSNQIFICRLALVVKMF